MANVLIRRSALGDVVLLGAITRSLPDVTVVTDGRYVEVARRLIGVRHAVAWPEVPTGDVIDLQGGWRWWGRRIHKRSFRRRLRLWTSLAPRRPSVPELYAEAAGVAALPPPWIAVPEGPRDTLALVPGAAFAPKRPRADRLIAAARSWEGPVVVLGGPGEEGLVEGLAAEIGATPIVERGFERTIAALGRTRVALAGDTGLMHLAGACGARVVALFGPTHPDDGFFVYPGVALGRTITCRPCALHRIRHCRRGDLACADIDVDEIRAAIRCDG